MGGLCTNHNLFPKIITHGKQPTAFPLTITMLMTTILLSYFMRYKLKWNKWVVIGLLIFFSITIESAFFIANVAKIKERWMFLFFELFIFLTMYVWHYARQINNRLVKFTDIGIRTPTERIE